MEILGCIIVLILIFSIGAFFSGRNKEGSFFISFFKSFFIGYFIGRFWKPLLVAILILAVLLVVGYMALSESARDDFFDVFIGLILPILLAVLGCIFIGFLLGLIPYFIGKARGNTRLGKEGLKLCTLSGLFTPASFLLAIIYTIRVLREAPDSYGRAVPALKCLTGPSRGRVYPITDAGIQIGRDPNCTIAFPINDTLVSRYHCTIRRKGTLLILTDTGSANGTFIDGGYRLRPQSPVYVTLGMVICIGDNEHALEVTLM